MDRSPSQYVDDDSTSRLADRVGLLIDGKYRVLRLIGHGSTGAVYACRHEGLDKLVALKLLHREMEQNASFVERFKLEAQAASRLEHPNSVRVLDFGQDAAGSLYIAMEYVEGRDLLQILEEEGPFDTDRAVEVMSQILDVLGVAHSAGIVHRDLKPENILVRPVQFDGVTRELVTVCDFGIAQFGTIARRGGLFDSGSEEELIAGTPAYMSPEQARAEPQDARSDLYSAGVVLYQLLTHHLPFGDDDALVLARKHCSEVPPPPSHYGPVNPALDEVCVKALAKSKDARYQSAREMRSALMQALGSHGDLAFEPTPVGLPRWGVPPRASVAPMSQAHPAPPMGLSFGTQTPLVAAVGAGRGARSRERRRMLVPFAFAICAIAVGFGGAAAHRAWSRGERLLTAEHLVQPSRAAAAQPGSLGEPAPASQWLEPESNELVSVQAATAAQMPATPPPPSNPSTPTDDDRSKHAGAAAEADPEPMRIGIAPPPPSVEEAPSEPRVAEPARAPSQSNTPAAPRAQRAAHEASKVSETKAERSAVAEARPVIRLQADPTPAVARIVEAEPAVTVGAGVAAGGGSDVPTQPVRTVEVVEPRAEVSAAAERAEPSRVEAVQVAPLASADGSRNTEPAQPRAAGPVAAALKAPERQPVDADAARVTINSVASRSGVTKASLRGALNMQSITECYRTALREGSVPAKPMIMQVALVASMSGSVTSATIDAPRLPESLKHCVEQVARRGRVRDADTGDASANITLELAPR